MCGQSVPAGAAKHRPRPHGGEPAPSGAGDNWPVAGGECGAQSADGSGTGLEDGVAEADLRDAGDADDFAARRAARATTGRPQTGSLVLAGDVLGVAGQDPRIMLHTARPGTEDAGPPGPPGPPGRQRATAAGRVTARGRNGNHGAVEEQRAQGPGRQDNAVIRQNGGGHRRRRTAPGQRQEEMTGPSGTASSTTALTVTILSQSKAYLSNTARLVIARLRPLLTR